MSNPLRPGDPRQLGSYIILARLGEGGMGSVFLGRAGSGRLVAIKVIKPEFAYEDEFRARFRSEVNRARQVPPFCTAEVLDADPEHGTPYLVVEYVDGPNLAEVVGEQGPLTGGNLHSVAVGVATALTAIHGAGVIHRDLKPGNVLFSLGTPKVIDFGIARALEVTSQHTRTDQMVGTVAYMAPERFEGNRVSVTPAADVFAWGAVVAYAGTGRTPFAADSAAATAARILTQPPLLYGLSGPLRDLVALALQKDPADRPTAHELLGMLLGAGPHDVPGLAADLARRPELRRAAEAAQHSGRHQTGYPARRRRQTAEQPVAPGRGSRRRVLAVLGAAVAVLTLAGAGVGLVASFGAGKAGHKAAGTPSSPTATTAARVVAGPTVIDRLDRPGQWKTSDESKGSCKFVQGRMVVKTGDSSVVKCAGPTDTFGGDQIMAVDVTLLNAGSCAVVWFRDVDTSSYRALACNRSVQLELDSGDGTTVLANGKTNSFGSGAKHRLGVQVRSGIATLTIDGDAVVHAEVNEPSLAAGRVALGVTLDNADLGGQVALSNAEFRSL
jgi:predicted Ser/Thr protein kinase